MDLEALRARLEHFIQAVGPESKKILRARLSTLKSVFPFNEYEYMLMFLLDKKTLSFEDYQTLRDNYVTSNPYLELYGIAPRIFGEIWCREHLIDIDERFTKADKSLDPTYEGEYDLWVEGVKVEVKASRATSTKVRGKLEAKALNYGVDTPFWMNFQQIKLDIADVFIFIGVWTDRICYWVLSNDEVKHHPSLSHQHRGGIEYQIGITEGNLREFDKYMIKPLNLVDVILNKAGAR